MCSKTARAREIECGLLQRVGQDVMLADVQVGPAMSVEETRIKIDGDDPAGTAHMLGQPQCDASRPESGLQAVPAVANAQVGQALRGVAVKQGFNPGQPIACPPAATPAGIQPSGGLAPCSPPSWSPGSPPEASRSAFPATNSLNHSDPS